MITTYTLIAVLWAPAFAETAVPTVTIDGFTTARQCREAGEAVIRDNAPAGGETRSTFSCVARTHRRGD